LREPQVAFPHTAISSYDPQLNEFFGYLAWKAWVVTMAADVSLLETLADAVPKDVQLRVYHISTRPASVPALYSAARDQSEQKTYCESHLLSIALPQVDRPHELLVFAIEITVFTTESLTTIFVSKADSTGFLDTLRLDRTVGSILRNVTVAFLQFLINARLAGPRVVLSLFARSQNQYLFPGSVEYAGKHVLDDRQLVKWWCKTLDAVIRYSGLGANYSGSDTVAYMLVPGCDKGETKAFFPASANQVHSQGATWTASYPMELLVPDASAPLRCLIPRLPDDPKSRFLTDLDDSKDEEGQWRSVKTMEQFWETMSFRQECSAGRLVGFIWVVFGKQEIVEHKTTNQREFQEQHVDANIAGTVTPGQSQSNGNGTYSDAATTAVDLKTITLPGSPPLSIPAIPETRPLVAVDPVANTAEQYYDEKQALPVLWPEETRGELVVSLEQYDTLVDHLLRLDFSTRKDAEEGTSSFIAKAAELAGTFWGRSIGGRKQNLESIGSASMPQENGVNILTGVRKKRKVGLVEENSAPLQPKVNTLSAGLVKKKVKT
jgi:regulator of Ty1 transposition protein 109